jgi:hypothetical protein
LKPLSAMIKIMTRCNDPRQNARNFPVDLGKACWEQIKEYSACASKFG